MTGPGRVAMVTNVLSHYRVGGFREIAKRLPGGITYFLLADRMPNRSYVLAEGAQALPTAVLPGWSLPRAGQDDLHLNDIRPITRGGFDTLLLGAWDEPTYLLLWAWAVARQIRLVYWIESTAQDASRGALKEAYKRLLLSRASACAVAGKRAREYCRRLGVPEERLFNAPNAADRPVFQARAERLLPQRDRVRAHARLDRFTVLFAGRFQESLKGVSVLIRACGRLERQGTPVTLLLAGDGPDAGAYRELAAREGLRDARLLGLLDHEALSSYYAASDVLVLPSFSEPWGFVLNEAMEFGLPLAVSDKVGAGPDLVREGRNGFVFPAGDDAALAAGLSGLAKDSALRAAMGAASREILEEYTPELCAEGVLRALHHPPERQS